MDNHAFCRQSLKEVMIEVRLRFTDDEIRQAWAWHDGFKHWEFHGPNKEYIYNLKMTDCLWSAKAEGWRKLLDRLNGPVDKNITLDNNIN